MINLIAAVTDRSMEKAFTFNLSKTNRSFGMILIVGFMAFINFIFINQALARNVIYESPMIFALKDGRVWVSRVHFFEGTKTLEVYTDISLAKNKQILAADISECFFCSGEEDNCAEDGITVLEISHHPQAIIKAVCHVGAHSQKLMIFDPKKSRNRPVLQRTGAYSLSSSQQGGRLSLTYDRYVEGSTCPDTTENISGVCEITENWP